MNFVNTPLVLTVLVVASAALATLVHKLWNIKASKANWMFFGLLLAYGLIFGAWCTFKLEYQMDAQTRLGSFPIPIGYFRLEDGRWVKYIAPKSQAWLTVLANIISITAVTTLPVWLSVNRNKKVN